MHSISSWTITVDDFNNSCSHESEKFDAFIFVTEGKLLQNINSNQILTSNLSLHKAKIIIIVLGVTSNLNAVFKFLNDFSLRNAIIVYQNKNKYLKLLTWPSDECGNLRKTPIRGNCTEIKHISKQIYKTKFQKSNKKCGFLIRGVHNPPFSILTSSNNVTDGIELKLISIIVSKLDIEARNVFEVGDSAKNMFILGHSYGSQSTNTIKYMSRYYTETYTWIAPRSASHPHWSNITNVFKIETWLFTIVSLISVSIVMRYINTSNNTDIFKCIFNSWGVFLNISVDEISKKTTVRIIFITWVLISIALTTVFQAFMTSYFTDPGKSYQINTFDELERSNLKLSLTQKAFRHDNMLHNTSKTTFLMFSNDCQLLEFCYRNSSVAALTTEERFLYISRLYFGDDSTSVFHIFTEDVKGYHRTLNMYARNPFVEAVNRIIINLVEAGIINKIVETFLDPSGWVRGKRMGKNSIHDYVPLSMFHMTSPFIYLGFGYLLSVVVFILEFVLFKVRVS
ncbi:hypothetical protein L9F63_020204 [Diploptera punctata]|uniref:Ionotropic glutamate receptor C-terminal domain-containing protein n=1 Tax=Diploptera punctata TaxID=6984 RepID=A0AAD7ZUK9_DIPPU|nr:hypothetical protein L9F63_020204 [Diploptera punctata]